MFCFYSVSNAYSLRRMLHNNAEAFLLGDFHMVHLNRLRIMVFPRLTDYKALSHLCYYVDIAYLRFCNRFKNSTEMMSYAWLC